MLATKLRAQSFESMEDRIVAESFQLGVSQPVRQLRDDIARRLSAARRLEREERSNLLTEHHARWRKAWAELYADCEAIAGHDWIDLPHNGVNRPHFITGEWPQRCRWCGVTKRHAVSAP